jgi:hypothetical protein
MQISNKIIILSSVLFILLLGWLTGPIFESLESENLHYRHQVDAFLDGRLLLSEDPAHLDMDMTWSGGGVQQVWGLGIPLWRLPFTLVTKAFGIDVLPDRIPLVVALMLWAYVVLRVFLGYSRMIFIMEKPLKGGEENFWIWLLAALSILCLPIFVTLLRTRLDIYEEAVIYQYIYATGLFAGLIVLHRKPSRRFYGVLCLLAGLGVLIRPTLLFYTIAMICVGGLILLRTKNKKLSTPRFFAQTILFTTPALLGIAAVLLTNWVRFEHPLEFGHAINLHPSYGAMYSTRFDYPYQHEPIISAAKELFGGMFLVAKPETPDFEFFSPQLMPLQSETIRWRELYFHTYSPFYFLLFIMALAVGFYDLQKTYTAFHQKKTLELSIPGIAALWGIIPVALFIFFYLRYPIVSSRYYADFAPAFAVMIAGLIVFAGGVLKNEWLRYAAGLILVIWIIGTIGRGWETWPDTLVDPMQHRKKQASVSLPTEYTSNQNQRSTRRGDPFLSSMQNIRFNGVGWNRQNGLTKPLVMLFAKDIEFVEVDLEINNGVKVPYSDWYWVRAKVQREMLERISEEDIPGGKRIRFKAPTNENYQQGIRVVFLALGKPEGLADEVSPYKLLAVRWADTKQTDSNDPQ